MGGGKFRQPPMLPEDKLRSNLYHLTPTLTPFGREEGVKLSGKFGWLNWCMAIAVSIIIDMV